MSVHPARRIRRGATTAGLSRRGAASSVRLARTSLWTVAVVVLTLAASLLGLFLEGVYTGAASTAAMVRGYDLVAAVVVAPMLGVATWMAYQGSVRALLTAASLVAYVVYTYAYYLFGTSFNDLFLLHAAVLATGLVALVMHVRCLEVAVADHRLRAGVDARGAAVVLGLLAVALGGMWVYLGIDNAVTGDVPAGSQLVETDTIVHLGMALDLTLLVPLYAAAALLLWQRAAWGYVLGFISLVAGLLHQVSYIVAMPFQVAADIPGAVSLDPGEPVIVGLYLLGVVLLVRRTGAGAVDVEGRG